MARSQDVPMTGDRRYPQREGSWRPSSEAISRRGVFGVLAAGLGVSISRDRGEVMAAPPAAKTKRPLRSRNRLGVRIKNTNKNKSRSTIK